MNLQKLLDDCHVIYSSNGHIFKDGKFFSCLFFDPEANEKERAYRVLEEHFRVLAELEALPKYAPNGLRKMQAVWYWVSTNFDQCLVLVELVEHCLANTRIWRGYDAFDFGGELSGYNDDVVHEAIQRGERFMTFADDFDRAAMWAKAHGYGQLSDALQAVQEMPGAYKDVPRAIMVKTHDNLVGAFWEVFKAQASRKEKREAMRYAFDK
jgi:hypothetical protein